LEYVPHVGTLTQETGWHSHWVIPKVMIATVQPTVNFFILNVTDSCTPNSVALNNRVSREAL
jgi:hypothetical protein